ncbi:MAG: PLP-dependent aminotransferase family protein [Candidatus Lambdaproteobacteria bacterium]|nr:PLP-dependent aminotransferase family protein [Candidatus Lambdaproteobacteria bacterium]
MSHPAAALAKRLAADGKPGAEQIVTRLAGTIRAGGLRVGSRLPPIRELARALGVNRNTVARAYKLLAAQGYLVARFGGGSHAALPAQGAAGGDGSAPPAAEAERREEPGPPRMGDAEWERLFARHPRSSFSAIGTAERTPTQVEAPINLFQLRPHTGLFPQGRFQACLDDVLRRSGRRLLNYGTPAGYLPLREQIAVRLRQQDLRVRASQILITSGSQQGIDLVARALLDPGDGVVVESPMYSIALKIFQVNGARLLPYAIDRAGVSFQALDALPAQPSPKLFYAVPNFQNPTTHTYSELERRALLAQLYRLGGLLIEDASDAELHPPAERGRSLAALAAQDGADRVLHLNTFSKTLVPALRVGYLVGAPPVMHRLTELKEMTDLSHSLILQAAIAEFLERGHYEEHVAAVRGFYRRRMEAVLAMLAESLPIEAPYTEPAGGLCVWVDLPPHVDTTLLYQRLQERGVLISPGALYQPLPGGRNGIRLSVALESEARLRRGIRILGQVLTRLLRRPYPAPQEEYQSVH